jgi:hypothetical protein
MKEKIKKNKEKNKKNKEKIQKNEEKLAKLSNVSTTKLHRKKT